MPEIQIINGDCIEELQKLKENSIDAVITDPPYNVSRETNFHTMKGRRGSTMDFGEWDKGCEITEFIRYLPRVLKENSNVVIFNSWQNIKEIAGECERNNITIKRCLVLNKSNPAPFNRDRLFVNDVEFAIWGIYNSKKKPTKWTFNRTNKYEKCVIDTKVISKKHHPTSKDPDVIDYLINTLTNEGDTVLDPFLGGGTTMLCCQKLNRNGVGIELEEKYYETSKKRLEEITKKA